MTVDGKPRLYQIRFTALDGNQRTDRWFSNEQEVSARTDVFDPDTDDDGLTDGQEIYGFEAGGGFSRTTYTTNAKNPDTDDDGYWDGWYGVYGVGRTDNVILYREHLKQDGIKGDERVDEQAGVHERTAGGPVENGADVDGDGHDEHSNIHIGELHWDQNDPSQSADPTGGDSPTPSLTVQVDYHTSVPEDFVNETIERAEKNYALYGMNVQYVKAQELDTMSYSYSEIPRLSKELAVPAAKLLPFAGEETDIKQVRPRVASINRELNDRRGSAYMFVTNDGGGGGNEISNWDWTGTKGGVASCQGADKQCQVPVLAKMSWGTVVFYNDVKASSGPTKLHGSKTMIHETGHLLGAGRADDGTNAFVLPVEIYSGDGDDDTPEQALVGKRSSVWSVMSAGWNGANNNAPMNGNYFALSIEEVSTIEFNEIETR